MIQSKFRVLRNSSILRPNIRFLRKFCLFNQQHFMLRMQTLLSLLNPQLMRWLLHHNLDPRWGNSKGRPGHNLHHLTQIPLKIQQPCKRHSLSLSCTQPELSILYHRFYNLKYSLFLNHNLLRPCLQLLLLFPQLRPSPTEPHFLRPLPTKPPKLPKPLLVL